jgi:hypothetical protein
MVSPSKDRAAGSNGTSVKLLDDEKMLWQGTLVPTKHVNVKEAGAIDGLIGNDPGTTCCITCFIPTKRWERVVTVTDQRIIINEKETSKHPGVKTAWYYLCCMCCNDVTMTKEVDEEVSVQMADVKNMRVNITNKHAETTSCMCCSDVRQVDSVHINLYLVKPPGETMKTWGLWKGDELTKTYHGKLEIEGTLSRDEAEALSAVLSKQVAASAKKVLQMEAANPIATYNVTL